ncbi:hypothetical protein ACQV5M_15220 [Leptospira sp. SA-E8]|uniref:hypothetical protein n=1 Tax=Leptospira sp. SA-E8 TaxID=3422259 RepID=UPI003EB77944
MKSKISLNTLIGIFIVLILLFHIGFFAYLFIRVEHEKFAHIGDSFGFVNSLFSGLAFALLIGTIYLQKDELKLQRQELSLTREEMRLSREAAEQSAKYIQEQAEAMKLDNEIGILGRLLSVYHEEEQGYYKLPEINQDHFRKKFESIDEVSKKREALQQLLEGHYDRLMKKS